VWFVVLIAETAIFGYYRDCWSILLDV